MHKFIPIALFLSSLFHSSLLAQVSALPPALLAKEAKAKTSAPLRVSKLDVEIKVTGNTAETTMTMVFSNDTDRVLEGELVFPLPQGSSISNYALEVNGKMRNGVVVEKLTARSVYEDTIRQEIDPGLVEWTKGNNFRTRIYPIPANGTKTVSLSYEETLTDSKVGLNYQLPLAFKNKIDEFNLKLKIVRALKVDAKQKIIIDNNAGLDINIHEENVWVIDVTQKNFLANQALKLHIPRESINTNTVFEAADGKKYFYLVDTKITPQKTISRTIPTKIKVIWDASNSGANRNHNKELSLLKRYLSQPGISEIDVHILRNNITKLGAFTSAPESLTQLTAELKNIRYDGATRISAIDLTEKAYQSIILISDGIATLGQDQPRTGKTPVFTLHASQSAEHSLLTSIANHSQGAYINLHRMDEQAGFRLLTTQTYNLISVTGNGIEQIYPSIATPVQGSMSISGIITAKKTTTISLNYGSAGNITTTHKFTIDPNNISKEASSIPRLWAQKQLAGLDLQPEVNKQKITALATSHKIVTRYTSLLVLDRIEDFVKYRIAPPASEPELLKLYNEFIKEAPKADASDTDFLTKLLPKWMNMVKWHKAKYADIEEITKIKAELKKTIPKNIETLFLLADKKHQELSTKLKEAKLSDKKKEAFIKKLALMESILTEQKKITSRELLDEKLLQEQLRILNKHKKHFQPNRGLLPQITDSGAGSDPFSDDGEGDQPEAGASDPFSMEEEEEGEELGALSDAGIDAAAEMTDSSALDGGGGGGDPFGDDDDIVADRNTNNTNAKITLQKWNPNTPYLKKLQQAKKDGSELEKLYFEIKSEYPNSSAFYLDVAQFFFDNKQEQLALRILSNVAELDTENPALLRILGHRYDQLGKLDLAELIFREVLNLRNEEPQSHRDLALILEKKGQLQEAADLLWHVSTRGWDARLEDIQLITLTELNGLIARNIGKINTEKYDKRLLYNLDCDIRIVLTWDADNTDIDLWVTDPIYEKCAYDHNLTVTGGNLSRDFTQGYGPEIFMIKNAIPGNYTIQANFYGNTQQTLAGETTVQATIFTNWGRQNEKRQAITLRLKDIGGVINIGEIKH